LKTGILIINIKTIKADKKSVSSIVKYRKKGKLNAPFWLATKGIVFAMKGANTAINTNRAIQQAPILAPQPEKVSFNTRCKKPDDAIVFG